MLAVRLTPTKRFGWNGIFLGASMLDPATMALSFPLIDQVCQIVSGHQSGHWRDGACKARACSTAGKTATVRLKLVGRKALSGARAMWR
ncbi:hypothetical protein ABIB66_008704 [Bradyrhizobium sp. F1.13.3]